MNGRSAQLSVTTNNGSDWSGYNRYPGSTGNSPYSPSFPHNRANLATPPVSGSSNGTQSRMSNGVSRRPGEPSPPNSVARSSYGTTASSQEHHRRAGMRMEEKLSQHYHILRRYLAQSLRDEKGNAKPNKARDKLLRLSPVQFQELSTDVYDELLRRQSAAGQHTNGPGQVPEYLLPRENFHPKRNQARQKLATLPSSRFRDLATDVFYELERRFPVFAGRDITRNGSPSMSNYGPPSRAGTPNGFRNGNGQGPPPRNTSLGSQVMAGLSVPGTSQDDGYGRPTAKTFQSNTIIPNKSTMVEDDDDDNMSDVYGGRRDTTYTSRSAGASEKDRKALEESQTQVGELQNKVKDLEDQLRDKASELNALNTSHSERQDANAVERESWEELRADLEDKVREARKLNEDMQFELDRLHDEKFKNEADMRSQLDALSSKASGGNEWKNRYKKMEESHQDLLKELSRQEKTTDTVKNETMNLVEQMRELSERSDHSVHREEQLVYRIHNLEHELSTWKDKYAKARTQSPLIHSESTDLIVPSLKTQSGGFHDASGLVSDSYVSQYQIAIDELLRTAHSGEVQAVLSRVKAVVVSVRQISLELGATSTTKQSEISQQLLTLKSKVSATCNNLITASRNFAVSNGLSPVSLLDAAASHLSTAVIELLRIVKIRPAPMDDLNHETLDDNSLIADSPADYYGMAHPNTDSDSSYSSARIQQPTKAPMIPPTSQPFRKVESNGITNGGAYHPPGSKPKNGIYRGPEYAQIEELKTFLDTRTSSLLSSIQSLVSSIRMAASPPDILDTIVNITSTTNQIIHHTASCVGDSPAMEISTRLAEGVERLEQKGREGEEVANEQEWSIYVKELPPLAFEIAREVKELGAWVDNEVGATGRDFA